MKLGSEVDAGGELCELWRRWRELDFLLLILHLLCMSLDNRRGVCVAEHQLIDELLLVNRFLLLRLHLNGLEFMFAHFCNLLFLLQQNLEFNLFLAHSLLVLHYQITILFLVRFDALVCLEDFNVVAEIVNDVFDLLEVEIEALRSWEIFFLQSEALDETHIAKFSFVYLFVIVLEDALANVQLLLDHGIEQLDSVVVAAQRDVAFWTGVGS